MMNIFRRRYPLFTAEIHPLYAGGYEVTVRRRTARHHAGLEKFPTRLEAQEYATERIKTLEDQEKRRQECRDGVQEIHGKIMTRAPHWSEGA